MDELDHWRLCDEISVIHAALLIAYLDPATASVYDSSFDRHNPTYTAARTALINAVRAGRLKATIRHEAWPRGYNEEPSEGEHLQRVENIQYIFKAEPDWHTTTVLVEDLRDWLRKRGLKVGFFFPQEESDKPDYLDNKHPNYSPKLAAAIEVWQAITKQPELVKAKSVKQSILIWLRTHAGTLGLIKDDGNPNESGIEEVAKVANWETKGGAPKTPEG